MDTEESNTYRRLLDKSKEAFLLAIELYNRPSIRYHVEGCAFFLCNAWELMLKAHLIQTKGMGSIYFKDKPNRTIDLSKCIALVFTNKNDPLRTNLEKITELRNTSTHFVTDEYEILYGPLFQVCVKNFDEKMKDLHDFEMSSVIPENYLILSVKRDIIEPEKIRSKYPAEVVEKLLTMNNSVALGAGEDGNPRYAGLYETSFAVTKDPSKADLAVRYSSTARPGITVVRQLQNVEDKYPYTTKLGIKEVSRKLSKRGIKQVMYHGIPKDFNSYHWKLFVDFYNLKSDPRYAHNRAFNGENPSYVYSQQTIDLIVEALERDPEHVLDALNEKRENR